MKHIKKILSAITALALILSMHSGCGMFTNYKAIAEQALEDKYGEEFVCHSTWDEGGITFSAEMSPAYDKNMKFYATISPKYNKAYTDKYPEAVVGNQIADIVFEETETIWEECCVKVSINSQGLDFSSKDDITIESFYQNVNIETPSDPSIHIAINEDLINEENYNKEYILLQNICKRIQTKNIIIYLYFIDNSAYDEYELWFNSTYDIYVGSFKNRDDFEHRIELSVNNLDGEYSMTEVEYKNERKGQ